jgi:hypothetical protein
LHFIPIARPTTLFTIIRYVFRKAIGFGQATQLGGAPGAALWAQLVARGWVAKQQGTRATIVTEEGKQQFQKQFGIQVNDR